MAPPTSHDTDGAWAAGSTSARSRPRHSTGRASDPASRTTLREFWAWTMERWRSGDSESPGIDPRNTRATRWPRVTRFRDRAHAGRLLGERLRACADRPDVIVLGLPRGGVPVAFEVAKRLRVPLDVFVVRKLGVPGHEELAMGAIASGGVRVLNEDVLYVLPDAQSIVEMVTAIEREELKRRERDYRSDRPAPEVR